MASPIPISIVGSQQKNGQLDKRHATAIVAKEVLEEILQ